MDLVSLLALFVSLLALSLFLIANYKKIFANLTQYVSTPSIDIYLKPGPILGPDTSVSTGGPPDDFERELMEFQDGQHTDPIEVPIERIQHPEDHSKVDFFQISIQNQSGRAVYGDLSIDADMTLSQHNPAMPDELNRYTNIFRKISKEMVPPGESLQSETLTPKVRYRFEDDVINPNGRSNTTWYIRDDSVDGDDGSISTYEISISFRPRIAASDLPRWIPQLVGDVELKPISTTFLIRSE